MDVSAVYSDADHRLIGAISTDRAGGLLQSGWPLYPRPTAA